MTEAPNQARLRFGQMMQIVKPPQKQNQAQLQLLPKIITRKARASSIASPQKQALAWGQRFIVPPRR